MRINRELLQKMHDGYMEQLEHYGEIVEEYEKMEKGGLFLQGHGEKGKCSALIHVINDIRHVLDLTPIGEDSDSYGYIFNVE